ncbi:MAG TPA: tol-pal system protein YbgF [Burkholderiales bacterium]|jgi:tol-pal system protein YbgF
MTPYKFARHAAAAAACLLLVPAAHAALFGDDEARQGVQNLQNQQSATNQRLDDLNSRVENQTRVQMDINAQLEQMKAEIARLRGQLEVMSNDLENAQKRQKDFYIDLDTRLRKVEPPPPPDPGAAPAAPTADEQKMYDSGLNLVKGSNYKSAAETFNQFLRLYPNSQLAPAAQYWLGNSLFALRDYKGAIAAQQRVVENWPKDIKAPDALLNISSAQVELKDTRGARATLEKLITQYPGSDAAKLAQDRVKRLR